MLTLLTRSRFFGKTALNSDQIQAQFGSYGVAVLTQTETLRLANLYSTHSGIRICRTLAVTHFVVPVHPLLKASDTRIRAGQSIGATLRADGFTVIRSDALMTHTKAGDQFSSLAGGTVPKDSTLAVQVYSLTAMNSERRLCYAVIAEAYHPAHIAPQISHPALADVLTQTEGHRYTALEALEAAL